MSAQLSVAGLEDIAEIDALNRLCLPENYDADYYKFLITSPTSSCLVVRIGPVEERKADADAKPVVPGEVKKEDEEKETMAKAVVEAHTVADGNDTAASTTSAASAFAQAETVKEVKEEAKEQAKEEAKEAEEESRISTSATPLVGAVMAAYILCNVQPDQKGDLTGHIVSIAVATEFRRRRLASTLLNCAQSILLQKFPSLKSLTLNVRKNNKGAQALYAKNGFNRGTLLRNYYLNPKEDAFIMRMPLK
jgi:ribosomal protein S18 acetylase RimI-like enzyme